MTLEAYANQVMSSIKVRLGEAYDVRGQIVRKNNGIELTGISIHQEGEKKKQIEIARKMKEGGISIDMIIQCTRRVPDW